MFTAPDGIDVPAALASAGMAPAFTGHSADCSNGDATVKTEGPVVHADNLAARVEGARRAEVTASLAYRDRPSIIVEACRTGSEAV